ncbi:MAG: DUF6057 family protein [Bacteroidota bacterium]
MINPRRIVSFSLIIPGVFFIACFLYFAIFNRYLMAYQEQTQLFRFDWNYFIGFLSRPGGLADYIGTFFIQFYLNPLAGAFIVTLSVFAVYVLSRYIFRKYLISGMLWSLIPALLIGSLQCDYMFNIGYTIGLLLVLTFFSVYISVRNDYLRYVFGFIGLAFLYPAAGGFSLLAVLICIIHELLFTKNRYRFLVAAGFAIIALLLPYHACKNIYYIPIREAWYDQIFFVLRKITKYTLLLFIAYFPLLLIVIKILPAASKKIWLLSGWNLKTLLAGVIVIFAFAVVLKKYTYNPKLNLFFEIDHNVQQAKWDKVLQLSSRSQEANRLILYYTNLALYKTGHLGDRMFYFNQIGVTGLLLNREKDEISLFLGGEIFYHLGSFNEAYRWAFDSMVTNGQSSPRLLKQLIMISLINGDLVVAEKFLNILDESLFYRKWAKHYRNYLNDNNLLLKDAEIAEKRNLLINSDFVTGSNDTDISLKQVLDNHPDNRMAFEYYMSSLLLNKNLIDFAANIFRIKDLGYTEMPVHYEEALLIYMGYVKKNVVPEGYGIRKTTVQRFKQYTKAYSSRSGSPETLPKTLYKSYGNTYWFYLHFINNRPSSNESSHPFN